MMSVAHSASTTTLLVRVLVAFALTFVLGFERELRGSPAGDRTFSLIGTASAVLDNLAGAGSPNAIAGAVTGNGFIGGGIVFRRTVRSGQMIDGITTAAAVFATAAIGAAAGAGLLAVAALATALVPIALEGPHPGHHSHQRRRRATGRHPGPGELGAQGGPSTEHPLTAARKARPMISNRRPERRISHDGRGERS
jgi:putative Mg2+ transporter-C (MgtC) family protein